MKKREALTVGQIIEQAIAETGNSQEYDRQMASFLWADVVGPAVNRLTTRRWVDRDVLHVCITSASLKNELKFLVPRLVENLNRAVGRPVLSNIIIH
ncbi:MAG: DUF721 domain-containing protein [Clostridium sp.]|nr:DUF721 domain-containing protein [Clostridium sp.]